MHDVAVIGAGAAGLTASISRQRRRRRAIIHRTSCSRWREDIGAKILVSGGGGVTLRHVVTPPLSSAIAISLERAGRISGSATIDWFASLGVDLKREETGKLFPVTDKARTILTALVDRCRALGVIIHPDHRVTASIVFLVPKLGS